LADWLLAVLEGSAFVLLGVAALRLFRLAWWAFGHDQRAPRSAPAGALVTVQLPVCNERGVVERLIRAAAALSWSNKEIQVLDDSDDETREIVDRVAAEVGATVLRRGDRRGFKAGNLANGFAQARGEFLLILDADSQPPADLVEKLMAPLVEDPSLAFAQARWAFENERHSTLTRLQAAILTSYFSVEQAERTENGTPVSLNGTSVLIRKSAIEAAGGWLRGDAASVTEDLDLASRMLARGARGVMIDAVTVETELPETMIAFRAQQARWVRGNGEAIRAALRGRARGLVGPLLRQGRQPLVLLLSLLLPLRPLGLAGPSPWPEWAWPLALGLVTVAAAAYYSGAWKRIGRTPSEGAWLAGPLVLLSIGLSAAMTASLLQGIFSSRHGEFVRTQKKGEKRRRGWPRLALVELLIGFSYLGCISISIAYSPLSAAGHALLAAGWLWVAMESLAGGSAPREPTRPSP
jgi:cellulose synthase/poly-beta-1,6-N-acetylglucosamine synthase-like glycosyltransferase